MMYVTYNILFNNQPAFRLVFIYELIYRTTFGLGTQNREIMF